MKKASAAGGIALDAAGSAAACAVITGIEAARAAVGVSIALSIGRTDCEEPERLRLIYQL